MERYGAPYSGGWMQWPLKWLRPVDTALNVYYTLKNVGDAMSKLEGKALAEWQGRNQRLLDAAAAIAAIRDDVEGDNE